MQCSTKTCAQQRTTAHNSAQLRCFENGNDDFGVEAFWIVDAARVGYFVPLNGPLNGHPPSLYCEGQYGFREKHSTQLAALELIDRITHELDLGNTPINIYIDLSKAFDTLDHTILISKLQHYGIKGTALQLLLSYL